MIRGEDLAKLKSWVNRYFKVYDVRFDIESAAFFCDVDRERLEEDFDTLRSELIGKGYIPMILFEGGEYILYVTEKAPAKYRSVTVNVFLLVATICTTVFVGAMNWWAYDSSMNQDDFWQVFTPAALGNGALYFAFPLMLILGIHESGHYFMARYHGVAASLPFFIPVPLPPLGTFGAFISMREPIPSKKALLDIGVAGPIAGFLVAVPVTIIGFHLTDLFAQPVPEDAGSLVFLGTSFFYDFLAYLFPTGDYLTHPTALAGWVGLLVTFLNLLPAGQLDGGHIARAMFGENAKYFSYASIIIMLILAFYYQYFGWILFIFIIVFIGITHPPPLNDLSKLDGKRIAVGAVGFIILASCFTPVPLYPADIEYKGVLGLPEDSVNLAPNETVAMNLTIKNTGNIEHRYTIKAELSTVHAEQGWRAVFDLSKVKGVKRPKIVPDRTKNMTVHITAPQDVENGDQVVVNLTLIWRDGSGKKHRQYEYIHVTVGLLRLDVADHVVETMPGLSEEHNLTVTHLGEGHRFLWLEAEAPAGWEVGFQQEVFEFSLYSGQEANSTYEIWVPDREPVSSSNLTLSLIAGVGDDLVAAREDRANHTVMNVTIVVKVLQRFDLGLDIEQDRVSISFGENVTLNVSVENLGNGRDVIEVAVMTVSNLSVTPETIEFALDPGVTRIYGLRLEPLVNRSADLNILVIATSKGNPGVNVRIIVEVQVDT